LSEKEWAPIEKYVRLSFWGLNLGLALMVAVNLLPGGVLQLWDVLENGYWHARGPEFLGQKLIRTIEWLRLPADAVFIGLGVLPAAGAAVFSYRSVLRREGA
jgi:nitric oxide reductase subunit B